MAAGVRLLSCWSSLAMLACLVVVHFDSVAGLQGGQGGEATIELLEEDESAGILEQLANAERIGSGEVAYDHALTQTENTDTTIPVEDSRSESLPVHQVNSAVEKATQVDLLTSIDSHHRGGSDLDERPDIFADAMHKWDSEKTALTHSAVQKSALLTTDLEDSLETSNEKQTLKSLFMPTSQTSPKEYSTAAEESEKKTDPLAEFEKEFSSTQGEDQAAHSQSVQDLADHGAPTLQNPGPTVNDQKSDWMTKALAAWGQEQDSSLGLSTTQHSSLLSPSDDLDESHASQKQSRIGNGSPHVPQAKADTDAIEQDVGDLGESDEVDAAAASATQNLDNEIEAEAQEAASQVVQSTMHAVERDFLLSEKAITHKLGENAPELTLSDLDKAGGKSKHEKVKAKAKKMHKEMVHKAKLNYELAIANVHKETQQQLANQLAGLKVTLRKAEDKILSESAIKQQHAKEQMEKAVRNRVTLLMQKTKAELPAKLTTIRESAEAQARKVAALSIQQITKGARKVRMKLRKDLGEAAGRVRAAEARLASSDTNPSLALKSAVDVRTEKAKYAKLHDLAESALVQQKSKAAKQIVKAEANAKESVRLAVKDAEAKELKEAREQLTGKQKKVEREEQQKLDSKISKIKQMAKAKIDAERQNFKKLVDTAVKIAPKKEKDLRMKAKVALHKAKAAAQAYKEKMISSLAPHTVDGKVVTKEMAAECVKNPSGCSLFTLQGQNTAAAAKFAESKARKAKRAQKDAKEGVSKALEKLRVATVTSQKYAQEARDMDEKETRIKLAKLQLNEAKAAAAFHSAAKAHLQTQLVHTKMKADENDADSKLKQFEQALNEMKVTHSEATMAQSETAKVQKEAAFEKARKAAQALLKLNGPP